MGDWSEAAADPNGLAVRFKTETTGSKGTVKLVKETFQPDRNLIMEGNKSLQRAAEDGMIKDMSFGRWVGRIPTLDFINLQEKYPDLFSNDIELARKATIKFMNSPEAAGYRIQKA